MRAEAHAPGEDFDPADLIRRSRGLAASPAARKVRGSPDAKSDEPEPNRDHFAVTKRRYRIRKPQGRKSLVVPGSNKAAEIL
jgi:hypothetical protein